MPDEKALVGSAVAGDGPALADLLQAHLPLVYGVVGRALDSGPDVDDVVQETMIRAVVGLPRLRDPERFRSWLVAIAIRHVQDHRRAQRRRAQHQTSLEQLGERPDPALDFVGASELRLGLAGQRREVAEAARQLSASDQELLALWWQEAAGAITRSQLADSLGISTAHAAVRVQRMKAHLATARTAVRLCHGAERCPRLDSERTGWAPAPAERTRARVTRHVRGCQHCQDLGRTLVAPELLTEIGWPAETPPIPPTRATSIGGPHRPAAPTPTASTPIAPAPAPPPMTASTPVPPVPVPSAPVPPVPVPPVRTTPAASDRRIPTPAPSAA